MALYLFLTSTFVFLETSFHISSFSWLSKVDLCSSFLKIFSFSFSKACASSTLMFLILCWISSLLFSFFSTFFLCSFFVFTWISCSFYNLKPQMSFLKILFSALIRLIFAISYRLEVLLYLLFFSKVLIFLLFMTESIKQLSWSIKSIWVRPFEWRWWITSCLESTAIMK